MELQLNTLQEKNARLEPEVARLQERETISREIEIIEIKKNIAEYSEDVAKYTNCKAITAEALIRYEKVSARLDPLKKNIDEAIVKQNDIKAQEITIREKLTNCSLTLKNISDESEKSDDACEVLAQNINTVKRQEFKRTEQIKKRKEDVLKNESAVKASIKSLIDLGLMKEGDQEPSNQSKPFYDLERDKADLEKKLEDLAITRRTHQDESHVWAREFARFKADISKKESDLGSFDNVRFQRYNKLKETTEKASQFKDVVPALHWLRENRQIFKGRVAEPCILEIELIDGIFAGIIEVALPWAQKMVSSKFLLTIDICM
jgi:chromosome segregation ATPase